MQMHEADSVEGAAYIVGPVAFRFIAVRVRDHCFCTNLPSARPSATVFPVHDTGAALHSARPGMRDRPGPRGRIAVSGRS